MTFAFVCGNMTSLVINLDKEGHLFQKKLDGLNAYMRQRELTRPLKIRTRTYARHVWLQSAFNEAAVLSDLSPGLRSLIAMEINEGIMRKIPLFSALTQRSMALLCQRLRAISASPAELVVEFGEIGREMYIVRTGILDVISGDGKIKYASLRAGAYFGEVHNPRQHSFPVQNFNSFSFLVVCADCSRAGTKTDCARAGSHDM